MRLFSAFLALYCAGVVAANDDSVTVSTVLFEDELSVLEEPVEKTCGGRLKGEALLLDTLAKKIQNLSGSLPTPSNQDMVVPMTEITSTSPWHTDKYVNSMGVPGRVGFLPLESNDDAYFDYGDTSCIPIKAGSFVHFDGNTPHNTVIKGGSVRMVGPFDVSTFASVEHNKNEFCTDSKECEEDDGAAHVCCSPTNQKCNKKNIRGDVVNHPNKCVCKHANTCN